MEPEFPCYAFGPFILDRSRRRLLRDGAPVALTPKAFDILSVLVEGRGEVVEKETIFRSVWPDTVIDEGSLTFQISALRKVLGERSGGERIIATIPGRGYQLVAPVRRIEPGESETVVEERSIARITVEDSDPQPASRRALLITVAALAVVASIAALFVLLRQTAGEPSTVPAPEIRSMAVLPFKPIVAVQRDEALEVGMADALITRLSHLPHIDVRSTSAVRNYGALDQDALEAARELKVDAVLDGTILRSGDRVRVSARLHRMADGATLWARTFDDRFTDMFDLQDRIAEEVALSLSDVLSPDGQARLVARPTSDVDAWELYVKGIYFEVREPDRAIEFFERAIARDESFAAAWAGIARASLQKGRFINSPPEKTFARARVAALNAIALDAGLADAHAALGAVYADHDWSWRESEASYRKALAIDEGSSAAHHGYGLTLLFQRKFDQALRHLERARELDPLSPSTNISLGMALRFAGRFDEAIAQLEATLEMYPKLVPARLHLGMAHANSGRPAEGMAIFESILDGGEGERTQLRALQAYAAARAGRGEDARSILAELEQLSAGTEVASFNMALAYAALGQPDRAFHWLDRARENRLYLLRVVHVEQGYEPLRSDPRYQVLIEQLGLDS